MTFTSITGWLTTVADRHGDRPAITFLRDGKTETEMSYAQLQRDIHRLAQTFLEMGIEKGDRVVLFLPKSLIAVVAHFAIQAVGAMAVPLNPGFKRNELAYLLGDAEAKLILLEPHQRDLIGTIDPKARLLEIDAARPYQELDFFHSAPDAPPAIAVSPDDPGLVIYTSGTTGNPKGAMLTHGNLISDASNVIDVWKITDQDVLCHALPLFHVHGLCFALHTLLLSGGLVRMLDQFKADIVLAELSRKVGDIPCSIFMAVPAMYTKLMDFMGDRKLDFSHMRLFTSGSAPLPVKAFQRIHQTFGREPVEREGMSETGMNFSNPLTGRRIPGSIGLPLPGVQVRIVDAETFVDAAAGDIGELWLKSPAITPGYWRKPRETAEAFHEGWFRTGDLGRVDEEGYYYLTDRIKHIIITGGENVSAKEVETVINRIDGVDESVVVGKPDEKWGEKVVAAVSLKPGAGVTDADIKAFCKANLHDWKCPKDVLFIETVPRNTMGKVLKEEVKKLFLE